MFKLIMTLISGPVKSWLAKASKSKLGDLAVTVGLSASAANADSIWAAVEQNFSKAVALFTSMGSDGQNWLQMLAAASDISPQNKATVEAALSMVHYRPNTTTSNAPMGEYMDEFRVITEAIRLEGSLDRLLAIRGFMQMPDEVLEAFIQFRTMARSL